MMWRKSSQANRISMVAAEIETSARDEKLDQIQTQVAGLLLEFENFVNLINDETSTAS